MARKKFIVDGELLSIDAPETALSAALKYHQAGLSVIPCGSDKKPILSSWTKYQSTLPSIDEIKSFFKNDCSLGMIAGKVSGNLRTIDFDFKAEFFERWKDAVEMRSPGLVARLILSKTVSGGLHSTFRQEWKYEREIDGNEKLAFKRLDATGPEEVEYQGKMFKPIFFKNENKWAAFCCLIETRSEGGYFLVEPSPGYSVIQGDLKSPPLLTDNEAFILLDEARILDESIDVAPEFKERKPSGHSGNRVGDDYNARGNLVEDLCMAGWSYHSENRYGTLLTRPGKDASLGCSAIVYADSSKLFVFSSNAVPFEQNKAVQPFTAFAKAACSGDFTEAAKKLAERGFGAEKPTKTVEASFGKDVVIPDPKPDPTNFPKRISDAEVVELCKGTIFGTFIEQAHKIAPVYVMFPIAATLSILSPLLSRTLRIGNSEFNDINLRPNSYVMLVGGSRTGKGLCARAAGACSRRFDVPAIDQSSDAKFIDSLSASPFGLLDIAEFSSLMGDKWESGIIPKLTDGFDNNMVSLSTRTGGNRRVFNSAPSAIFQCQTEKFENSNNRDNVINGFLPRDLIAFDPKIEAETELVGGINRQEIDIRPIHDHFEGFFKSALPELFDSSQYLKPAKETEKSEMNKKNEMYLVGSGVWEHPIASITMKCAPYISIIENSIAKQKMLPFIRTSFSRYLPQLAIPFCTEAELQARTISAAAQAKAEKLLINFIWDASRLLDTIPISIETKWLTKITNFVRNHPGCKIGDIRTNVYISSRKSDFNEALTTCIEMGLIRPNPTGKIFNDKPVYEYFVD